MFIKKENSLIIIEDWTESVEINIALTFEDIGSILSLLNDSDMEKVNVKLEYLKRMLQA